MTTQSAIEYITYRDSCGTQRRKYKKICETCGKLLFIPKHRLSTQKNCTICNRKKPLTDKTKKKISLTLINRYANDSEWKRKIIASRNVRRGEAHWNWKGGVTPINQRERTSEDSLAWKRAVLYRDDYKCRICNSLDDLCAHHINGWAEFPEDRFILENGLTLCKTCHTQHHAYEYLPRVVNRKDDVYNNGLWSN